MTKSQKDLCNVQNMVGAASTVAELMDPWDPHVTQTGQSGEQLTAMTHVPCVTP